MTSQRVASWKSGSPDHFRYLRVSDGPRQKSIQTALRTFIRHQQIVGLFGVAHSGLDSYYQDVESHLLEFDRVLLEGISSETIPELKAIKEQSLLMARILGVTTQHALNIDHDGWENGDMDPATYKSRLAATGLSLLPEGFEQRKTALEELLADDDALQAARPQIRGQYADFVQGDRKMFGHLSSEDYAVIEALAFDERNAVVVERLNRILDDEAIGSVAILFGADHLTGIEQVIRKIGFEESGDPTWLTSLSV